MLPLLLPYFSGFKNKRIKQKTNPAASKMKLFVTLIDDLFQKQLNNIKKNPISDGIIRRLLQDLGKSHLEVLLKGTLFWGKPLNAPLKRFIF